MEITASLEEFNALHPGERRVGMAKSTAIRLIKSVSAIELKNSNLNGRDRFFLLPDGERILLVGDTVVANVITRN